MFEQFVASKDLDMFVTGRAGTGKTTKLAEFTDYCEREKIPYLVVAHTHKACGVIREAIGANKPVKTLHSYLKKRPAVNDNATRKAHVSTNVRTGVSDKYRVVFVDEYSIVGEKDVLDIRDNQDAHEDLKIVWLGDPYQLPPVGDQSGVKAFGRWQLVLSRIWRTGEDNPLLLALSQLVSFIEGADPEPLIESAGLRRGLNIANVYAADDIEDKVMLAWTNRRVQELNALVQGYDQPVPGDKLFCTHTREYYEFIAWEDWVPRIDLVNGDELFLESKYKTLEHLMSEGYKFARVLDRDGEELVFAAIFGHGEYRDRREALKASAASINASIGKDPKAWALANPGTSKARERARAWRNFLSFDNAVVCLDFVHALTVHKSQGSSYTHVYVDTEDLGRAADLNYSLYLRLMYVAFSRARKLVVTN